MASTATLEILIKARDDASRTLGRVQGATRKLASAMKLAAGAGVVALAGLGIASVKMAADFEAAMSESIAIMGDVSDAMRDKMARAARDVALTTTFSAKQAAEAYFFLASAGLDAAQSIEALPKVAAFAQAGAFDMALATDLLTDAQSALGLTVDDTAQNMENMTRVSDVLVGANTLANASVQQFSEALTNKAGPALRATNKSVEEGVAVLGVFADQGIKGSEAGTQLGIVLRDLQTKALKNKAGFAEMGIAVFDAQGNMNNMADIIGDIDGALGGMSVAQQKATLLQLGFSDKSVSALQALLGSSEAIRDYEKDLRSMAGVTDEVAKKQLDNFNAQLSLLKSAFQDVMITVGNKVLPQLTRFTKWLRGEGIPQAKELALTVQRHLEPWMQRLRTAFDKLQGPAQKAGEVLKGILVFLNNNREILAAVAIAIGVVLVPAFVAWAVAAGAAAIATIAATLPIIAIIAAIALLVLGIILLVKNWDTVTAFIVEKALWLRDKVVGALEAFGDFIKSNWPKILLAILAPWLALILVIIGNWDRIWATIKRVAAAGWDVVVGLFNTGKDRLIEALQAALNWLANHWQDALLIALAGPLGLAIAFFKLFKVDIVSVLETLATEALEFGKQIPEKIWEGIKSLKDWLLGKAGEFVGDLIDLLNPANWSFSPENMAQIYEKQGRLAGTAMMRALGSALTVPLPQLTTALQPASILPGVGSSRLGGSTVNVIFSGPINLSGSATQQDADDLIGMVKRGLRSDANRGL
jgi:TP901 family phage tail tape measure protein